MTGRLTPGGLGPDPRSVETRGAEGAVDDGLRFARRVLDYTRVPLVTTILVFVVLLVPSQGRDLAVGLSGHLLRLAGFALAVLVLATQVWLWARLLLSDRFGYDEGTGRYSDPQLLDRPKPPPTGRRRPLAAREFVAKRWAIRGLYLVVAGTGAFAFACMEIWAGSVGAALAFVWELARVLVELRPRPSVVQGRKRWLKWLPRLLAGAVWTGSALALWSAGSWGFAIAFLLLAGIHLTLLVFRTNPALHAVKLGWIRQLRVPEAGQDGPPSALGLAPVAWLAIFSGVLGLVATLATICLHPQTGFAFGAATVVFLHATTLCLLLSALIYGTKEIGLPVVQGLLYLFILTSITDGCSDNHRVRTVTLAGHSPRKPLSRALARWQPPEPTSTSTSAVVVVAAAGGGLRAAYWTARVLSAVEARDPSFRDRVFAISGVSGGALGATLWTTWGANVPSSERAHAWRHIEPFFDKDYLAPLMAGAVGPDLGRRFIPWVPISDRATYLGQAWEAGFEELGTSIRWSDGLLSLYSSEAPWVPLLLLNGTHMQTGRRVITGPITVEPHVFPQSIDFYETLGPGAGLDVPISTAAHNASRFAVFSPPGRLWDGTGHVIDGGYLENSGAATALDVFRHLAASERAPRVAPVVIQITNDASISADYGDPRGVLRDEESTPFSETAAPLVGLYQAMNARADRAAVRLASQARTASTFGRTPIYAHFRLFPTSLPEDLGVKHMTAECLDDVPAPLGWVLSPTARQAVERQLWCRAPNRRQLARDVHALTGKPEAEVLAWSRAQCEALPERTEPAPPDPDCFEVESVAQARPANRWRTNSPTRPAFSGPITPR